MRLPWQLENAKRGSFVYKQSSTFVIEKTTNALSRKSFFFFFSASLLQKAVKYWLDGFRLDNPFSHTMDVRNQQHEWNTSIIKFDMFLTVDFLFHYDTMCFCTSYTIYRHHLYTILNAASNPMLMACAIVLRACIDVYLLYTNIIYKYIYICRLL